MTSIITSFSFLRRGSNNTGERRREEGEIKSGNGMEAAGKRGISLPSPSHVFVLINSSLSAAAAAAAAAAEGGGGGGRL